MAEEKLIESFESKLPEGDHSCNCVVLELLENRTLEFTAGEDIEAVGYSSLMPADARKMAQWILDNVSKED